MKTLFRAALCAVAVMAVAASCENDYQYIPDKPDRPAQEDIDIDGQFPIIAWTGIDAKDTGAKFGPMKECGINTYLGWYATMEEVKLALANAEKAGVKCIIRTNDFLGNIQKEVPQMKDCPALLAYEIMDEPETSDFAMLKDAVSQVNALDPDHPCYINVYPNWAWGGAKGYAAKLTQFLNTVPVTFLSFDYYPIRESEGVRNLRPDWYYNLEDVRTVSRKFKIPFWAFALSLSHSITDAYYPVPTIADLRLQQFSNLVYGAQAFQYFTYWGIYQGAATPVYEKVKQVNTEIQSLAFIFKGADVKNVWHTGKTLPNGTKALSAMPYGVKSITSGDEGIIVSQVEKDGKTYIAIVNRDYQNEQTVSMEFTKDYVRYDNCGYKMTALSDGKITMQPGDIAVFEIK